MKNLATAFAFIALVMLYEADFGVIAAAFGLSAFVYFTWAIFQDEEDI